MKRYSTIDSLLKNLTLRSGMSVSFHHHLRNGDLITNKFCHALKRAGITDITLMSSALFPCHKELIPMVEDGTITSIITNYINGPLAEIVSKGKLQGKIVLQTHGGRPRSILNHERTIDLAVIVVSAVDSLGNANGIDGTLKMGSLGYPVVDLELAKQVVLVTDTVLESLSRIQLSRREDALLLVTDHIGNSDLIEFGTTSITKNPVNLKIARDTVEVIVKSGYFQNGFSFQTGAGGTSLAVLPLLEQAMKEHQIKGSFISGGITSYGVKALEEGYFEKLYDVQSFDSEVTKSIVRNKNHILMSASEYANPDLFSIADQLDIVILGATEIDTEFNVNVCTDSNGVLIGGSGGHSDVAHGAKCTIVVSNLVKARTPIVVDHVTTLTTPGKDIDCLVTEFGIAVNPSNKELSKRLREESIPLKSIQELRELAKELVGQETILEHSNKVIGEVEYRDGTILDLLYQICT